MIQNTSSLKAIQPASTTQSIPDGQQSRVELPSSTNSLGFKISAEAQFIFEMDKYLIALDRTARQEALDYLSSSDNFLQRKAAECFLKVQEKLGEDRKIVVDTTGSEQAKKLLDINLEINGATEIAVMPMAAAVFRLDGNETFYPVRLNYRNDALKYQLNALEETARSGLGRWDKRLPLNKVSGGLLVGFGVGLGSSSR